MYGGLHIERRSGKKELMKKKVPKQKKNMIYASFGFAADDRFLRDMYRGQMMRIIGH